METKSLYLIIYVKFKKRQNNRNLSAKKNCLFANIINLF